MIEFSNCCCCVKLRTGCLILGFLNLIWSIQLAVAFIIFLKVAGVPIASSFTEFNGLAFLALSIVVIIVTLITVLFTSSLLLVKGIRKDRRSTVKTSLILYVIFIVLYVIILCIILCTFGLPQLLTLPLATILIIQTLLNVYFLLVFRSYWVTMDDGRQLAPRLV